MGSCGSRHADLVQALAATIGTGLEAAALRVRSGARCVEQVRLALVGRRVGPAQRTFSVAERPDIDRRASALTESEFPEYNRHCDVMGRYWSGLWDVFSDFQFVLYDEEADEVLGEGHRGAASACTIGS